MLWATEKTLVMEHSENPGPSSILLQVSYGGNEKVRRTRLLLQDAFLNCQQKYYLENNIPFKVCLWLITLLDSHLSLVIFIQYQGGVLPPDTPSDQRVDRGVIVAFQAHYMRGTCAPASAAMEGDTEKTLMQFWKGHNARDCIA